MAFGTGVARLEFTAPSDFRYRSHSATNGSARCVSSIQKQRVLQRTQASLENGQGLWRNRWNCGSPALLVQPEASERPQHPDELAFSGSMPPPARTGGGMGSPPENSSSFQ